MRRGEQARRRAGGFTYVGLLAAVVLIGLVLGAAGEVAATAARRDREVQLLWAGHEYRAAIGRYWSQTRAYPQTLQELLGASPDGPAQVRYLRRLYPDPMTNAVDWVLVSAPSGGIMGVASSSRRAPLKTDHFDEPDQGFKEASSYGDWRFTFAPSVIRPPGPSAAKPAATQPPPGVTSPVRAPSSRPR
jgi:type II secretory pathway pseudopilin PulG